jgi:hypothetical protein
MTNEVKTHIKARERVLKAELMQDNDKLDLQLIELIKERINFLKTNNKLR